MSKQYYDVQWKFPQVLLTEILCHGEPDLRILNVGGNDIAEAGRERCNPTRGRFWPSVDCSVQRVLGSRSNNQPFVMMQKGVYSWGAAHEELHRCRGRS